MYWTYLRRELAGRTRQTAIVAAGLAVAIALVIVVSSLTAGIRDAQANALASVYGVGTDITVTGAEAQPGQGGPDFEFGQDGGQAAADGSTALSQSRLMTDRMRGTLDDSTVETVASLDGVSAASGALALTNSTFSGELPQAPADAGTGATDQAQAQGQADGQAPPDGGGQQGQGGFGGGSFDVDSFSVLGIDPAATAVGPLSAVSLTDGRALAADDAGADVAVVDATYATANDLAVGGTVDVGGTAMQIVGIVTSTSSDADTAANVYLPLDVAQTLAGVGDVVSTVYVKAASADAIDTVQTAIDDAVPDATVSSESDLAATVSGSLASAGSLITSLGTWLSIIVLGVAVLLAVLFTVSGVSRRTREFGTLKAIGWSSPRVVGQVAGESVVQGLIGGAAGLVLGLTAIAIVNVVAPTISSTTAQQAGPGAGGPGGGFGPGAVQTATDIVLHAPVTVGVVVLAVALAIGAGLVAGAFGGWRAARLSPAEALRSVA